MKNIVVKKIIVEILFNDLKSKLYDFKKIQKTRTKSKKIVENEFEKHITSKKKFAFIYSTITISISFETFYYDY